jgi:aryl-alcohol dehydrogenase-like predicted oxidoreductase
VFRSFSFNLILDMIFRFLGKTGLKVSVLGFGNWLTSNKIEPEIEESTYQCMKK